MYNLSKIKKILIAIFEKCDIMLNEDVIQMKFIKRVMIAILFIVILVIGIVVYMGYSMYQEAITKTSIAERIQTIKNDENYISFDEIPTDFKHAIVAVEDHRFYTHGGIDIITTTRSLIQNIKEKDIVSGRKYHYPTASEDFYILLKNNAFPEKSPSFLSPLI